MTTESLFSRHDLASRWRCSIRSIDRLRSAGLLPWLDLSGGRKARPIVRFRTSDVNSFEESTRRSTKDNSDCTGEMKS